MTPTKTVKIEVEVPVSRCEICQHEELAKCSQFQQDPNRWANDQRFFGNSYSFPSNGYVRFNDYKGRGPGSPRNEWELCSKHLEWLRAKVEVLIAEERAKVS